MLTGWVVNTCVAAASPETHHHRAATGAVGGGAGTGVPVTISDRRPAILSQSNDPKLLPNGTGFSNRPAQKSVATAGRRRLHEPYGRSLAAHASRPATATQQAQEIDRPKATPSMTPAPSMMPERWYVPRGCEIPPRALAFGMLALPEDSAKREGAGTPLQPGDTVYVADVKFVRGLPWAKV